MFDYRTMIATNRFGLGARPGEAAAASNDPRGWLREQLEDPGASVLDARALKPAHEALADWYEFQSARRAAQKEKQGD